jgi:hypothetical protein
MCSASASTITDSTLQCLQQRQDQRIHEQQPVACMVEYVGDLLWKQARIYRVDHGAHAGDGVIKLEVAVIVPGQGGDTVAGPDPVPGQRRGQPAGARKGIAVAIPVARLCAGNGHDFLFGVLPLCVAHDGLDRQWHIHHQPGEAGCFSHRTPPLSKGWSKCSDPCRHYRIRSFYPGS